MKEILMDLKFSLKMLQCYCLKFCFDSFFLLLQGLPKLLFKIPFTLGQGKSKFALERLELLSKLGLPISKESLKSLQLLGNDGKPPKGLAKL